MNRPLLDTLMLTLIKWKIRFVWILDLCLLLHTGSKLYFSFVNLFVFTMVCWVNLIFSELAAKFARILLMFFFIRMHTFSTMYFLFPNYFPSVKMNLS